MLLSIKSLVNATAEPQEYEREFVQPVLTENGTVGGDHFAVEASLDYMQAGRELWRAFNGNFSDAGYQSIGSTVKEQWVTFYNPKPLNVTSLRILQFAAETSYYIRSLIVQGSNDNSSWEDIATWSGTKHYAEFTVDMYENTKFYNYYRIYVTDRRWHTTTHSYLLLSEVAIYGFEKTTERPPSYKYQREWEQPIMTSNGTMGGDSFAVDRSSAHSYQGTTWDFWNCIAGISQWHAGTGKPQWVSWYNPNPLVVTKLDFVGHAAGNILKGYVLASNNSTHWRTLTAFDNPEQTGDFEIDLSFNKTGYKYYKIHITDFAYTNALIQKGFKIIATELYN